MRNRTLIAALIATACCGLHVSAVSGRAPEEDRSPRRQKAPKKGEVAPTFRLKTLDGKAQVDLASFADKRPVILFFGSYT
ncbi:MAG: hypothetical protein O7B26_12115 [Planctomycetota bacterium]|nr:hypothetical protein [Planctomycetota bacterium]